MVEIEKITDQYPEFTVQMTPKVNELKTEYACVVKMTNVVHISDVFEPNSTPELSGSLGLLALCASMFTSPSFQLGTKLHHQPKIGLLFYANQAHRSPMKLISLSSMEKIGKYYTTKPILVSG